jgi:hypothetical protein
MAGKVANIKVYIPLKQRSGLTGNNHAICHYSYNLPLATRLTKNINDENDNEKYYLTTKTKTKNPLMKRHCKLEGIYFSLPAFALSGN